MKLFNSLHAGEILTFSLFFNLFYREPKIFSGGSKFFQGEGEGGCVLMLSPIGTYGTCDFPDGVS